MSKKISFGAAVAFMAIIAAATFSITWIMAERNFNDKTHNLVEREKMYDKLAEAVSYTNLTLPTNREDEISTSPAITNKKKNITNQIT